MNSLFNTISPYLRTPVVLSYMLSSLVNLSLYIINPPYIGYPGILGAILFLFRKDLNLLNNFTRKLLIFINIFFKLIFRPFLFS